MTKSDSDKAGLGQRDIPQTSFGRERSESVCGQPAARHHREYYEVIEGELKTYFEFFGEIEEVRIIKNKEENVMRGFGFVLFYNRVSYNRVFEYGETHTIRGKQVESCHVD